MKEFYVKIHSRLEYNTALWLSLVVFILCLIIFPKVNPLFFAGSLFILSPFFIYKFSKCKLHAVFTEKTITLSWIDKPVFADSTNYTIDISEIKSWNYELGIRMSYDKFYIDLWDGRVILLTGLDWNFKDTSSKQFFIFFDNYLEYHRRLKNFNYVNLIKEEYSKPYVKKIIYAHAVMLPILIVLFKYTDEADKFWKISLLVLSLIVGVNLFLLTIVYFASKKFPS